MPQLLKGAVLTVEITFYRYFWDVNWIDNGLRKLSKAYLKIPAMIYIDSIRGTPLFVQILLFYYGLPNLYFQFTGKPFTIDPMIAAVVVCSLNSGAYVAEIVRAGIQSIERGQMEAARSLGMSHTQAMRYIILPQAFKRIVPPLGNEFIVLLKDTSLLSVIGVVELTQSGKLYVAATYAAFPAYIGVALVYLVMTLHFSICAWTERRLGVSDRRIILLKISVI